jgi:hypothetical protein
VGASAGVADAQISGYRDVANRKHPTGRRLPTSIIAGARGHGVAEDPASATFSSRTATTVSMSASLNIGIDVDAILAPIFASVHAQINASVSRSTTTDIGNRFGVTVPAGKPRTASTGSKSR